MNYVEILSDLLDESKFLLSTTRPSDWVEQNRIMPEDSPLPGPYRYSNSPYVKEIIDCLSPDHPAHTIAVMKGAQIGLSAGLIESGIGWIIAQNPGNILFLSGHQELAEEQMNRRIDQMIDSCGLRSYIRPTVKKKKNQRTGDTATAKEFPGGSLVAGSASNHKLLKQRSVQYGFIDDFDGAKRSSKESGNTRTLIKQRFAAYKDKKKIFHISTPELKETSNIEPSYLLGDQRKFHVPCPCCGEYIVLHWEVDTEMPGSKDKAGITWQLDEDKKLIAESVGYICQKCGGFFDDSNKLALMNMGEWRPTAEPSEPGYYSYHISSLYAPPFMDDWEDYVRQYLEACHPEQPVKQDEFKTFKNLVLGETFEQSGEAPSASAIQKNIREYPIMTVPENISEKDGNGKIIILTCAADMNGVEDDARLDYEIVAWSESGSCYSITHGSIGTFIPRESQMRVKVDRYRWTYENRQQRNVWDEFEKILATKFQTDSGRKMGITVTALDCGHYANHAYTFIDQTNHLVFGVKGDKEDKFRRHGYDMAKFKPAKERSKLYILDVNYIKDCIADYMQLKWNQRSGIPQPPEFMNFPIPSDGKYLFDNFFSHYEAEHSIPEVKDGQVTGYKWVKKQSNSQNHLFDCRVYNMAIRDIWAWIICREAKLKTWSWADFVRLFTRK